MLGAGTMLGGRGIPTGDATDALTIGRKKDRYRRDLRAPVEDLLAVLNDPDAIDVKEAADAIEQVDPAALIKALGGDVRKIRPLAADARPEVRRAALWALARSRDVRVAPVLIGALADKDPDVYLAARDALRYLCRRVEGFGLPDERPGEVELNVAIKRWWEWFDALKVQLTPEDEFGTTFEAKRPILTTE
jgi:HEAT repeat protein